MKELLDRIEASADVAHNAAWQELRRALDKPLVYVNSQRVQRPRTQGVTARFPEYITPRTWKMPPPFYDLPLYGVLRD